MERENGIVQLMLDSFAKGLFRIGAIKFGAFRLKLHEKNPNAPLSPIYINLRILRSFPYLTHHAVSLLMMIIRDIEHFDLLADVPTAATPIVAVLSEKMWLPMITPREAKTHGSGGNIDGIFNFGERVLLIDDLITKADSKLEAIKTLEQGGLIVKDVVVLIDREQGGIKELEARGYKLHAALKLSEILNFYLELELINRELYDKVTAYLAENK